MSTERQTVEVIAAMNADKVSKAALEIKHLNVTERALNGGKLLGIFWIAGVFCILIPVLHFFLVPGAILIGLAFGIRQFLLKECWVTGEVTCPECQTQLPSDQAPYNWPKHIECAKCGKALVIRPI